MSEVDHRDIGRDLKLFMFHEFSPGSCFFLPHGTKVYNNVLDFLRYCYRKLGYQEVITPNIFNHRLWEISGHYEKYKSNMFLFDEGDSEFGLKPMNCPGHCLMAQQMITSYKDLPLRLADFGVLHRNELSGTLTGLTRVRRFQQDDAHIFCALDQVQSEIQNYLIFLRAIYDHFGLSMEAGLSTRPDEYIGDLDTWNKAEAILEEQISTLPNWKINKGDAAFYGPKIDFTISDSLGRKHQCGTLQLDFNLPQRFNLSYVNDQNQTQPLVLIHRAIFGSVERFLAILLEHTRGNLPFWLSPRRICVVPVTKDCIPYAQEVATYFEEFGAEVDASDLSVGKKIRTAEILKYNYIFIVGLREQNERGVNIRVQNSILGMKSLEEAKNLCQMDFNKQYIF